jgi:PAS domain S-box-containing protein
MTMVGVPGFRVLVVEDHLLIALGLQRMIESLNCVVAGPACSVDSALDLLDKQTPDAALLDEDLRGVPVTPVAEALRQRGIPFAIVSGYERSISGAGLLVNARRLRKPTSVSAIRDVLNEMQASTGAERAGEVIAQINSIVDASSYAILSRMRDGTIISWNKAAERLFGYSGGEIIGQSIDQLIPSGLRCQATEADGEAEGGTIDYETRWQHKTGRLIGVSISASPLRATSGKPIGVVKIAREIGTATGLEVADQLLVRLKSMLEHAELLDADLKYLDGANWQKLNAYRSRMDQINRATYLFAAKAATLASEAMALCSRLEAQNRLQTKVRPN